MHTTKRLKSLLLLLPFIALLAACKKDVEEPPVTAAGLQAGRAAIKFTASKAFNGDKEFDVNNTNGTVASNAPLGSTVRNIKVEATDVYETGTPSRKAIIDMAINGYAPTSINLARSSGLPLGNIRLESYSIFGVFRHSTSGTISITKFTATEIEGTFSVTFDDGMVISNGKFAGRF